MHNIYLRAMGNLCQKSDESNGRQKYKRKIGSMYSRMTSSSQLPELENVDSAQIISLLHSEEGASKRRGCPHIAHLKISSRIGKGAQAHVFRASMETQKSISSSRSMGEKVDIAVRRISRQNKYVREQSTTWGSEILMVNECQFLIKGIFVCEGEKNIYQGIDFAEGGDLTSFLEKTKGKGDAFRKLGETGIRLVVAGVVLALEYLHNKNFIYCDLKADNVLIGSDGYPLLTDFDLVKKGQQLPCCDFHGTLTSVGPQIFTQDKYGKSVDLWALGIMIYMMIYDEPPFCSEEINQEQFPKLCKQKEGKYAKIRKISMELSDLINKLLRVVPEERLGYNNLNQIKNHQFFRDFDWNLYETKEMENPLSNIVENFRSPLKICSAHF